MQSSYLVIRECALIGTVTDADGDAFEPLRDALAQIQVKDVNLLNLLGLDAVDCWEGAGMHVNLNQQETEETTKT